MLRMTLVVSVIPCHLVNRTRITGSPNYSHFDISSTIEALTKWSHTQKDLLRQFTKQWRKDYLRENQKARPTSKNVSRISLGDIVILKDDFTKRAFWKLAVVESLLSGGDGCCGKIRQVWRQYTHFATYRSVKHIHSLEESAVNNTSDNE